MIKKVLIANRGEIALRVIRACRELDIRTVAVYSDKDAGSLHVQQADEAICIGPAPVVHSYLNIPNIISAALIAGSDAIHPGYGFLAENPNFVEICETHNIKFIGPSKESMALMGDKARAREFMKKIGVPILPGTGQLTSVEFAKPFIEEFGFPVIIKAVAGGGGKGMRIVRGNEDFLKNFNLAQAEAKAGFADDRLYIEKFLDQPRHIEIQLAADVHGQVIHFGERDCSVQRRNQKLIEEAPCSVISEKLREQMGQTAKFAAKSASYKSLGTIEFLLEKDTDKFYFMEMNTRIQVEHPVTEMVTGIDLLKEQIRIAQGEALAIKQEDVEIRGHSIECRINAENSSLNFSPSCGTITRLITPGGPGVRLDTHIYQGMEILPFYDSLLAKLITFGYNRKEAIDKMHRALSEFVIEGIHTTIPFHLRILNDAFFRQGEIHTKFVEDYFLKESLNINS